jgi:TolB-like protein/Flp pilus assembly protein TadD
MTPPRLERVEEIFHAALECKPDQLSAFLDKACAGEEALRRKVEELLAAHRQAASFIERSIANVARSKFGDFEIARREDGSLWELGRGGMGITYRARDNVLHRSVALKVIECQGAENSEIVRERFLREARAAAVLRHPNVAAVYQFGTVPEPARCYYAMELVEGETLEARVRREGPLKVAQVLEIAVQVTRALIAASHQGLIHRDLKPGNIMLTRSEDSSAGVEVKVIDFGLAKVTAESFGEMDLTHGQFVGTPSYASPEQFAGGRVDARSDIYSLGASLWFALTARLPCAGANLEEIRRCQTEAPLPVQQLVARKVPTPVIQLLRSMLAVDPDERPASTRELMEAIEDCRSNLSGGDETTPRSFFAELQRRNVYNVAAAYAVIAWLLIQAASILFPTFEAPSWVMKVFITIIAAGFPVSLILAWAFELTPQGIKRTREVAPAESLRRLTGRKIAFVIIAFFALMIGLLLYDRYRPGKTPLVSAVPEKSIALLPFQNLSEEKDTAYFADGIQEEILTRLSKIADLKVISRSSTQRYRSPSRDLREVAKQLGVAHVLEGSVQKAADQVRVNVQLINARTDSHLWAEKFDRKLTDIFAVETEIATKTADTLQAKLTGAEQRALSSRPTSNSEAHQLYLKGLYYWNKYFAPGFEKSGDYFQQAIDLDPNYAPAYAGLAVYHAFGAANGFRPPAEGWPKSEAAANRALALDDTLAEAYNPLAALKLYQYRDWAAAERAFRRGIELNPNFAEIHNHYAVCLVLFGRNEEALSEVQRAVESDPFSPRFNVSWGRILFFMRQYDRAIDQFQKTLELDPNYALPHEWLAYAYEKKGMQKEAIAELSRALNLSGAGEEASILDRAYASSGFEAAVRALAQKRLEQFRERTSRGQYVAAVEFATAHMRLGDKEQAFAWLTKAAAERNRFALEIMIDPLVDPLRADPRFKKIADQIIPPAPK